MADKDALLEKQLLDQSAAAATAGNVSSPASYALVEIAKYSLKEGTQSFAYIEELDKTGENRPLIPISSSDECLVIRQSGKTVAFLGSGGNGGLSGFIDGLMLGD